MAGHSHSSNIKHKKDRNDKLKSELFLKIRRKIELAYNVNSDKERIFSIAREHSFPKEKVNAIIEKIEKSRDQKFTFTELLYKGKYGILIYLSGKLTSSQETLLEENARNFSLEKLHFERPRDYFSPIYSLRINGCENTEEVVFSSLPTLVVDKIVKIEKRGENENESEIFFSEKWALAKATKFFTLHPYAYELKSREIFIPLSPVYIESTDFLTYLSLLRATFSGFGEGLQVFMNTSGGEKWDHSSVG